MCRPRPREPGNKNFGVAFRARLLYSPPANQTRARALPDRFRLLLLRELFRRFSVSVQQSLLEGRERERERILRFLRPLFKTLCESSLCSLLKDNDALLALRARPAGRYIVSSDKITKILIVFLLLFLALEILCCERVKGIARARCKCLN